MVICQMNRVQFYRRSQMKEELISPNKNIPAIKQRVFPMTSIHGLDYGVGQNGY